MNLFINTKKKENQRLRKQTCGYHCGEGRGDRQDRFNINYCV